MVKNLPVDTTGQDVQAFARARVTGDGCPRAVPSAAGKAVADWVLDTTLASLGGVSAPCTTSGDLTILHYLDLHPLAAPAAIGEPRLVLSGVRNSTRVEIVD